MNVLVVATHPDDEVLGCGGVIARHVAQGDRVYLAIVTRGILELFPHEMVESTRQHMRTAHELLGGSGIYSLDFPAPRLDSVPGHELADAVKKVVDEVRPAVVYTPFQGDLHGDHQATFHATLVATRPIGNCSVRRLLCYETLSETDWASPFGANTFVPTVYIDISDYLALKLRAMQCYRNELRQPPHARSLQSIEALARVRGGTAGLLAAEAFALVREVVDKPVTRLA